MRATKRVVNQVRDGISAIATGFRLGGVRRLLRSRSALVTTMEADTEMPTATTKTLLVEAPEQKRAFRDRENDCVRG